MGCGSGFRTQVIDISCAPPRRGTAKVSPPVIRDLDALDSQLYKSKLLVQSPHTKRISALQFNEALLTVADLSKAVAAIVDDHGPGDTRPRPTVSGTQHAVPKACVRKASTQMTKSEVLGLARQQTLHADRIGMVTSLEVQQPMNCCNITALAFSLCTLGFKTSVDDILMETDVEPTSIVSEGLTLAQTYVLATTFLARKGYPVMARCYHFDAGVASFEGFWYELSRCASDASTVFVLNFHSGIAHGKAKGGGHFALAAAVLDKSREIVVSDVHPLKYGRFWTAPAEQIFDAMVDKDSSSQRSRGMLVFHKGLPEPGRWPRLQPMSRAVSWETPEVDLGPGWAGQAASLRRFVPQGFHDVAMSPNLAGASALTLALLALEGRSWSLRKVMSATGSSYVQHLNNFLSLAELRAMARKLEGLHTRVVPLERTTDATKAARELLRDLMVATTETSVALLRFDTNVAYGCEVLGKLTSEAGALTHGAQKWAAVAAVDGLAERIVIADPHPITMTRLWWCSAHDLLKAMRAIGSDDFLVVGKVLVG